MSSRRCTDSRGRVFSVPPPDWRLGLIASPTRRLDLHAARAAIHGVPSGLGVRVVAGACAGGLVGGLTGAGARWVLGPGDLRAAWLIGVVVGGLTGWGALRLTDKTPPLSTVGVLLSDCRLCIACGYDLEAIPDEADGCTVCPECGVAVRLMPRPGPEPEPESGAGAGA